MSYEDKLSVAKNLIQQHNQQNTNTVSVDGFLQKLKEFGGTSEEALQECSWEDLEICGLPRILARTVAKTFRSNGSSVYRSRRSVESMSVPELLAAYDPTEPDNHVGKRLKSLSQGKRVLVLHKSGDVLIEPSTMLLQEIRNGLPEVLSYSWRGEVFKTYPVGFRVDNVFDENPLYPGQPLRSGETCGISGLNWSAVPTEIKQIIYIAVSQTKEISTANLSDTQLVYSLAVSNPGELKTKLPKATLKFSELEKVNKLPSLKLVPEAIKASFGEGKRVL